MKKNKNNKDMSTHIAYFFQEWTDVDENTSLSMQDYINGGWDAGGTEGDKWIGRAMTAGETVETTPDMIVMENPLPKTGFTPPTPPFKPW